MAGNRGRALLSARFPARAAFLAVVLLIRSTSEASNTIDFSDWGPEGCTSSQYFDTALLRCIECSRGCDDDGSNCNKVPDEDSVDIYGNALSCRCDSGFVESVDWVFLDDGDTSWSEGTVEGSSCVKAYDDDLTGHRVALSDGSGTVSCVSQAQDPLYYTEGVDSTGDCACPNDADGNLKVLVEDDLMGRSVNKTCHTCPDKAAVVTTSAVLAGVAYSADPYQCQRCPDPHMDMNDQCTTCDTAAGYSATVFGVEEVGAQSCLYEPHAEYIDNTYFEDGLAYEVRYWKMQDTPTGPSYETETLDESFTMKHYFMTSSTRCYFFESEAQTRDCQALANLCVLQLYDPNSPACAVFRDLQESRVDTSFTVQTNWKTNLPWLYYAESGKDVRDDKSIGMEMTFSSRLRFYLTTYSLNGTWLGFEDMSTQLYYCTREQPNSARGGGTSRSTKWMRFGTSQRESFECDLEGLLPARRDTVFHELWMLDESTGRLFPVPVLLRDYKNAAEAMVNVNVRNTDESDDVFVRRFFLYDGASGLASGYTEYPKVLRYAVRLTLRIKSRTKDPSKIHAPVLEVTYRERKPKLGQWSTDMKRDKIVFEAEYSMDGDFESQKIFLGFLGTACGLSAILWYWRNENWRNRNTRIPSSRRGGEGFRRTRNQGGSRADAQTVEAAIPDANFTWSWFSWCAVMQLGHSFTLFIFPFVFLYCTYWFVFFKMQDTVYIMLPPENGTYGSESAYFVVELLILLLFFFQTAYVLHLIYVQCNAEVFFVDMENKKQQNHISVWRRIFVANEWAELQAQRPTSLSFSLIFMGLVLLGLRLENLATPQPDIDDHSDGQKNLFLRFASHTWWFVVLEFVQLLWNRIAQYWPIGLEPKGRLFVDLCTVTKIAVLVLDEKYHGYVIHRDGPPSADTTMEELTEHLLAERSNPSTGRGLFSDRGPEFEDVQCGELFLTDGWARWYHGIRAHLDAQADRQSGNRGDEENWARNPARRLRQRGGQGASLAGLFLAQRAELEDRVNHLRVNAMEVLNKGLRMFIQREFKDELHWDFAEPKSPLERILRTPPIEISFRSPINIIFPDPGYRFTQVHFYGIEFELWLQNVLTFAVCDIWFDSVAVSIICTYLLYKFFQIVRVYYGSAKLANTSLVDETFFL